MSRIAKLLAAMGAVLLFQGMAIRAGAQPTATGDEHGQTPSTASADGLPEEFVILNGANDFGEFLKKLKQPDWIFRRGGTPGTAASATPAAGPQTGPRSHVVNTVKISGRLDDDRADLSIELELDLLVPGTSWVPLGIESPVVTSAREGEKELELRSMGEGRWDVRLQGRGAHRLELKLERPIKVSPERKHLELAIPLSAATFLELEVPRAVHDVDLGTGEAVGRAVLPGGKGTRLSAHVSPRSRLSLDWTDEENSSNSAAPVLSAQVEMLINADVESITTQSSWVIRCARGTARRLEVLLDEADVVPKVKLDDQYFPAGIERNVLTIPLGEPLRPGETRHLFMETRRTFPPGVSKFTTFSGYPLLTAAEQTGAIGIHPSPNLWINVTATQGLRRIDPGNLPPGLRTEPGTSHAFLFLDQPFKLGLGIESAPPLFRSESETRLELDGELARMTAAIDVHQVRGRLFEIDVAVPRGMQLLSIGPSDLVESTTPVLASGPAGKGEVPGDAGEILRVHFTRTGRDQRSLKLILQGQERIGQEEEVKLGLFVVRGGVASSNTISLFGDPRVTFELLDQAGRSDPASNPLFRIQPSDERSAPAASGGAGRAPLLVLKSYQNPTRIRGKLTRHPREITHDTRILAQVAPRKIDVRQETSVQVRYGSIRSVAVRVPVARSDLWQVQGKERIRREELESQPGDGPGRRYRLSFDPPIVDRSNLSFAFQVPMPAADGEGSEVNSTIPWVVFEEGISTSTTLELATAPGMKASARDATWARVDDEPYDQVGARGGLAYRPATPASESAGFPLQARWLKRVPLPSLVAPRALFRTLLGPENESRTHAWYWIETHPPQVSFSLPQGAQWIRSRIDGRVTEQLEREPSGDSYVLGLPPESQSKPVLIEIEYQSKGEQAARVLLPPELSEGAVILQSLWEVHVPWSRAILGVPDGWADENEWYWDVYVWKRRPSTALARLLAWVSNSSVPPGGPDESLDGDQDDSHSYLFGRSGRPALLRPWLVSRALVVAICSGSVLLLGFYLMFFKAQIALVWAALAVLGLLAACFARSSAVLFVLQSAVSGLVLTLLGLLIQALIERTRSRAAPAGAGPPSAATPVPLSPTGVGSDDSTAIRVRSSSTMDYVPPLNLPAEPEAARGSQIVPSG